MTADFKKLQNNIFSQLPQVDWLLQKQEYQNLINLYPRELVVDQIRNYLNTFRKDVTKMTIDELKSTDISKEKISQVILSKLKSSLQPNLKRVINATGIILNTGLGRAPLSKQAQRALLEVSAGFSSVEIDLPSGKRGNRHNLVEELLTNLTGAEAAAVVNNNAAATLLTLNTLSDHKETIVSRGELITIGGSFRIPDIMKKSGAIMREIGTTNHTKLWEYEDAINEHTGLLLKVHTSNYKIVGFVSETSLEEMATLGKKYNLPVMHDLGSGMLFDLSKFGLPKEPVVSESIKFGADVVTFSGDKLLGGPQAGIIVGKKKYLDLIKKNQLARAVRCGKLTFAALEATLRLFFDEEKILAHHPALRMMLSPEDTLQKEANKLKKGLKKIIGNRGDVRFEKGLSEVGGGSLAAESLPTRLVSVELKKMSPEDFGKKLRLSDPPIITRIVQDRTVFDVRTLIAGEIKKIIAAVSRILQE